MMSRGFLVIQPEHLSTFSLVYQVRQPLDACSTKALGRVDHIPWKRGSVLKGLPIQGRERLVHLKVLRGGPVSQLSSIFD